MNSRMWRWWALGAMLALLTAGCGRATAPEEAGAAGDGARNGAADGQSARPAVPQTADAAARAVIEGLKDHRPQALWDFLPARYQSDVNELVREFARRMDRGLWNESFAVARKFAGTVREKEDFVRESPLLKQSEWVRADDVVALAALLGTLADSEAADLDRLKSFDGGRFLARTGGRLLDQIAALEALSLDDALPGGLRRRYENWEVTLVSSEADQAVVQIDFGEEGVPPEDFEFVRVEGKWIPRDLAETWDATLSEYRRQMLDATDPETLAAARTRGREVLAQAHQVLDRLEATGEADEFNRIVARDVVGPVVGALFRGGAPVAPAAADRGPAPTVSSQSVTVIVRKRLDDATEEALQVVLGQSADSREHGVAIPQVDGDVTRFEVAPVRDPAAFARRIDFGRVVAVDEARRTVTVELGQAGRRPGDSRNSEQPE